MSSRNVFRGMFDAMVESRSRQADAYIRGALSMLDENDRRRAGFPPAKRRG